MTTMPILLDRSVPPRDQRGAALIIGLIMLMVLTLLGVTALSNVTSQEKMAGGLIDRNRAFQAAEMALRLAEQQAATASGAGVYDVNAGTIQPDPYNVSGWSSNSIAAPAIYGTATAPRYRIERQIKVSDSHPTIYRLSAIGFGNRDGTNVVLQTTFGVPVF